MALRVFMSGQQTMSAWDVLTKTYPDEKFDLYVSNPPFNRNEITHLWTSNCFHVYDVGSFGLKIPYKLNHLYRIIGTSFFEEQGVSFPQATLDLFVQEKLKIKKEKAFQEITKKGMHKMCEYLENMTNQYLSLTEKSTLDEWFDWLVDHSPKDFCDNLEYEKFMGMFGVDKNTIRELCAPSIMDDGKMVSWAHMYLRWFIKAIVSSKGSGADIVNVIYAIMDADNRNCSEENTLAIIQRLIMIFSFGDSYDLNKLVTFDIHVSDEEVDDRISRVIINYVRHLKGMSNVKVIMQLPSCIEPEFEKVKERFGKYDKVFFDKDSRNYKALKTQILKD
jgi:hypothetical protein